MVNWPSAPIFQTPARKPKESPTAIRINGVALTIISERVKVSVRGSKKMVAIAANGFSPSTAKRTSPNMIVKITAKTGVI